MAHSSGDAGSATTASAADAVGRQVGGTRRLRTVRPDGTPVYRHEQPSSMPAVTVTRLGSPAPCDPAADDAGAHSTVAPPEHRHAHDFLVLTYVERDVGAIEIDGVVRPLRAGEVLALSPGQAVTPVVGSAPADGSAWSVSFTPDAVPALASVSPLTWTGHPLLALFTQDAPAALVPEHDRDRWSRQLAELATELAAPERLGAREAVTSLLTRVLIDAARLAPPQPDTRDPLVERVFDRIEETFREPVSAADVASALGYTPGHLTTLMRERTGRPLLEWITERRLTEVRRMLRETDLPLGVVAARTGLRDASYLVRRFRNRYGVTPQRWRESQSG
ncbi:AraC-like DNA-binding protein [Prauserella isguenensis]|uniref:AraC-like DNA-binding protein n=1 Tax=Prauserella isguenensis TaxID=1470180 RepID=A0A839S4F9_9PSEU|nr:AraC family transcriptional regulator [Prauserella isguenensis]MBB3051900.1 AraC-like DNA-binding protein [Prauserella isguenensis]